MNQCRPEVGTVGDLAEIKPPIDSDDSAVGKATLYGMLLRGSISATERR